jgi:hypothetical protein
MPLPSKLIMAGAACGIPAAMLILATVTSRAIRTLILQMRHYSSLIMAEAV